MTQNKRFWFLILFIATVVATGALSSCMNQEGIAPAEGELKGPAGGGGGGGY